MRKVLIVGSGLGADTLRQACEAMGAEVRVCELASGIAGFTPIAVIVDELFADVDRVIVDGHSPHMSAAGLLASMSPIQDVRKLAPKGPRRMYGNNQPYLRRKKGRS